MFEDPIEEAQHTEEDDIVDMFDKEASQSLDFVDIEEYKRLNLRTL